MHSTSFPSNYISNNQAHSNNALTSNVTPSLKGIHPITKCYNFCPAILEIIEQANAEPSSQAPTFSSSPLTLNSLPVSENIEDLPESNSSGFSISFSKDSFIPSPYTFYSKPQLIAMRSPKSINNNINIDFAIKVTNYFNINIKKNSPINLVKYISKKLNVYFDNSFKRKLYNKFKDYNTFAKNQNNYERNVCLKVVNRWIIMKQEPNWHLFLNLASTNSLKLIPSNNSNSSLPISINIENEEATKFEYRFIYSVIFYISILFDNYNDLNLNVDANNKKELILNYILSKDQNAFANQRPALAEAILNLLENEDYFLEDIKIESRKIANFWKDNNILIDWPQFFEFIKQNNLINTQTIVD
jgi:hypothetical protein